MLQRCLLFSLFLPAAMSIALHRDADDNPIFANARLTSVRGREDAKEIPCPEGRLAVCSSDCSRVNFCVNGVVSKGITVDCPVGTLCDQNKRTPICSKEIRSCAVSDGPGDACLEAKFVRDVKDCLKFTFCDRTGTYEYVCENTTVFDEKLHGCSADARCVDFGNRPGGLCYRKSLKVYVSDPADVRRYVQCSDPPRFTFCPHEYAFNQKKQDCEFRCVKEGLFENTFDSTRQIYFECRGGFAIERKCPEGSAFDSRSSNCASKSRSIKINTTNSAIKTISTTRRRLVCPKNYAFDPKNQKCSFECRKEGTFSDSVNPVYYYECVEKSKNLFLKAKKTCPSGTIFDDDIRVCLLPPEKMDENELACEEEGLFPDPKDSGYYYDCRGVATAPREKCQKINIFDEQLGVCSTGKSGEISSCLHENYVFDGSSCVFRCPAEGRFVDLEKGNRENYYECARADSDLIAHRKTCVKTTKFDPVLKICTYSDTTIPVVVNFECATGYVFDSKARYCEFVCPDEGLFKDVFDASDRKYFECTTVGNKTTATKKACLERQIFVPEIGCLTSKVPCSEGYKYDVELGECVFAECVEEGKFSSSEGRMETVYLECSFEDDSLRVARKICPDGSVFDPASRSCLAPGYFACPEEGSFPDPSDRTGVGYYECTFVAGKIVANRRSCPEGTEYLPNGKNCGFKHTCPPGFKLNLAVRLCEFECATEGSFPDYVDPSGSYYYRCTEETDGIVAVRKKCRGTFDVTRKGCSEEGSNMAVCHGGYRFDIRKQKCEFDCKMEGNFLDPADQSGLYYYECTATSEGYAAQRRKCPEMTTFNHMVGICIFFIGNAGENGTTEFSTERIFCRNDHYEYDPDKRACRFSCPKEGRFPDKEDAAKRGYFECSRGVAERGEEIVAVRKECSDIFNEQIEDCSSGFVCEEEGVFYDPKDSGGYYECAKGLESVHRRCQEGATFDAGRKSCLPRPELPENCPEGYRYEDTRRQCEFACEKEGRFADSADPSASHYFECIMTSGPNVNIRRKFSVVKRKCFGKTNFDSTSGICLSASRRRNV